ncbi:GroES-like protein [Mytilinidion resinicola]|uniref:GroES-like protein n=1 Tax=Mytilinidion resinicola TaxID=574789 RepID=A0A6A6Z7G2_9PEZI|nr:GroES-like protein [Mytilinidion resinicola]KAF2816996.1 GroES-like protein [Mytilinidion resinicola]
MVSFTVFKGSKDGSIQRSTTYKPALTGNQVLVRVTASGVCGTDEHYRGQDMVLGHEGMGVVEEVGPGVQHSKKGDRVGWGYETNACGHCEFCLTGRETFCPERETYGASNFDQGSFAHQAVWSENFLFKIPDSIPDEEAAPLMCGGATVFNALRMYDIQPDSRVAIIGVGGLGHLAIQFASKMGCEVVVFSGSESKREEAKAFGASEFFATKGVKELDIGRKIDCLLVTTSFQPDWNFYLPLMNMDSVIIPLSVAAGNLEIPYMPLILQGIRIQGSLVASRGIHTRMLAFAAQHSIKPTVMKFPMNVDGITDALQTLNDGKMRYRAVLMPEKV